MKVPMPLGLVATSGAMYAHASIEDPQCVTFKDVFADAEALCNGLYGDAFRYETDEENAYTMWHFEETNPNDAVATNLGFSNPNNECGLQSYHKEKATPENIETFTECHPWQDNACCDEENVDNIEVLRLLYGQEYAWDICGPVSHECERFYVQENCFYECDRNIGYYRRFKDLSISSQQAAYDKRCDYKSDDYNETFSTENNCNYTTYDARCDEGSDEYDEEYAEANDCESNTWEAIGMPIKASYCKAWFNACRNEPICKDGNVLECGAEVLASRNESDGPETIYVVGEGRESRDTTGLQVGLGVTAGLVVVVVAIVAVLIAREKKGNPVFESSDKEPLRSASDMELDA